MEKVIYALKAVSDTTRLRILMSLLSGELCICKIIALLELAPSTISKHISVLKQAGFVATRKDGKWIYVKLNDQKGSFADDITKLIKEKIKSDKTFKSDSHRLKNVDKLSREEIYRTINLRKKAL